VCGVRRREFNTGIGRAAGSLVIAHILGFGAATARGQNKVWRVGQLLFGSAETMGESAAALRAGLAALGDERMVLLTDRYVLPDPKSAETEIAAMSRTVDLLVVWSTIGGIAAKRVAPPVPVIFISVGAPVEVGLVESLARPGGNMTGVSFEASTETYAKRLQLLKDIAPTLKRVAVLRAQGDANGRFAMMSLEEAAPLLGVTLLPVDLAAADQLDKAFADMKAGGAEGVIVVAGALTFVADAQIATLALAHRLPWCSGFKESVRHGGLVSLGPDFTAMARQGASYVDKIIHGAHPADLPVEQPVRYEVRVNLKTAQALGLAVPQSILARADEVVE
jgi:putative ABC transport system substrate-binding protein